jgi:ABC-type antimicrobial peptide transport system permease subunit
LRFDDLVRVSLRQVVRHRRRYLGVVLAIAVGVAGFISIITMGQDVKKKFNKDLAFIGGVTIIRNVLEFRPQYPLSFNNFHADTIRAIREIPGVVVASLVGFSRIDGFWKGQPEVFPVVAAIPKVVQAHQPAKNLLVEVSWENLAHVKQVAFWIEFFIYLAFASTLTLGGMGIWNIMMAAVRTRTREIGLKKAMRAEDRDILAQFLTEALCLSLVAAVIGVALGRILVELLGLWIGMRPPEELFVTCLALSLIFAVALGVGAGLYPSLQAARMEVVSATRYE